jgi:hypothetical protein
MAVDNRPLQKIAFFGYRLRFPYRTLINPPIKVTAQAIICRSNAGRREFLGFSAASASAAFAVVILLVAAQSQLEPSSQ